MTSENLPNNDNTNNRVYHKIIDDGNTETEYTLLPKPIRKLRPISVIENVAHITTYLPLKEKAISKKGITSNYNNFPFTVTSEHKILNLKVDNLKNVQLFDLIMGEEVRWEPLDVMDYLNNIQRISLKEVFEQISNKTGSIIELKSIDYLNVYVLWAIGTYFYKIFEYYPYLDFSGSKGAGKSKAMLVLECLCYNAKMSHQITGPGWARIVESLSCTLLIDEQESLLHPKTELSANMLTLLNSAFRTHAQQMILVPDRGSNWKMKHFEISVPVALGHISPLNDVTEDRTIPMKMIISANDRISDAEVDQEDIAWKKLRNLLYRSFLDYFDEVIKIKSEPILIDNVTPRERNQIWKPIIVLARLFERHGGITGLEASVLRVVRETHDIKVVNNQSRNKDIQILEILCEGLTWKKIQFADTKKEYENWFKQEDILDLVHKNSDLRYMSSKELGMILDRLRLVRKKKNPYNMCVFLTELVLMGLCKNYHIEYQKLGADSALLAQSNSTQSAPSATSASDLTTGDKN